MVAAPKGEQDPAYTLDALLFQAGTVLKKIYNKISSSIIVILVITSICAAGCSEREGATEQIIPRKAKNVGERVYGPIEPVILRLPEKAVENLKGTDMDGKPIENAYIYFKIFNIVVYRDDFDIGTYVDDMAAAFAVLADDAKFVEQAEVWAVQMQKKGTSSFVTIAVTPSQAVSYSKSKNMGKFLKQADYLMISDVIIPPDRRFDFYRGKLSLPAPETFSPSPR